MKVNCIIVDDEPAARDILQQFVSGTEALHLTAICGSAMEASKVMQDHRVQLMFLDIHMPQVSGMQFYRSLENPPFVIFTTAYPQFAVEGFEVNAVDYLLKPFPFNRFEAAVNKAVEAIRSTENTASSAHSILLKADKKIYKVNLRDLSHLKAVGDYVQVFFQDQSILVHSTFQHMLNQLPPEEFVRIHKSHAIALGKIESISGNAVKLKEKQVPIGQSYRTDFLRKLS